MFDKKAWDWQWQSCLLLAVPHTSIPQAQGLVCPAKGHHLLVPRGSRNAVQRTAS